MTQDNVSDLLMDTYPNLPKAELDDILEKYNDDVEKVIQYLVKYQLDQRLKNANVSVLVDNEFLKK